MKITSLIFLVFLFGIPLKNQAQDYNSPIVEIHLQDSFVNDLVTLKLNGCMVFENASLTSDSILGITNAIVHWHKAEEVSKIKCFDKTILCNYPENLLNIYLSINGKAHTLQVDLRKGRYIGISKQRFSNDYILNQSTISFEYD